MPRHRRLLRFLLLLAVGSSLVVAGCMPDLTAPTLAAPEGTAEVVVEPIVLVSVPSGTAMPAVAPFSDTACLDCHTNQDLLMELAIPEEKEAKLSSGPG
jgi:hypothetical protein